MRRQRLGKQLIEFAQENNVPSVGPGGNVWRNQTNKQNEKAFNKKIWNGR